MEACNCCPPLQSPATARASRDRADRRSTRRANENLRRGDQAEQRACAAAERGEQAAIFVSSTLSATSGAQSALRLFSATASKPRCSSSLACQTQKRRASAAARAHCRPRAPLGFSPRKLRSFNVAVAAVTAPRCDRNEESAEPVLPMPRSTRARTAPDQTARKWDRWAVSPTGRVRFPT
jgi:hypothetical protein